MRIHIIEEWDPEGGEPSDQGATCANVLAADLVIGIDPDGNPHIIKDAFGDSPEITAECV